MNKMCIRDRNNVVWQGSEQGETLAQEGYAMEVDVAPGSYSPVSYTHLDVYKRQITFTDNEVRARHLVTLRKCILEDQSRLKEIIRRFERSADTFTSDDVVKAYKAVSYTHLDFLVVSFSVATGY